MKKKAKKKKKVKKRERAKKGRDEKGLLLDRAPSAAPIWDGECLKYLIQELQKVAADITNLEKEWAAHNLEKLHPAHRKCGENLVNYLIFRGHDLRDVQEKLAGQGLSSLGRCETHVMASVLSVLKIICHLAAYPQVIAGEPAVSFTDGKSLLERNTESLFGAKPAQRNVRIMVTVPSDAGEDYMLVRDLLANGMDCMRINCAHDSPDAWERMIENLKRAKKELGKKCRVLMDMGGPKLRTGPVEPTVPVIKWRPKRDQFGRVMEPARIWLKPEGSVEQPDTIADMSLSLPGDWLGRIEPGEVLRFTDARLHHACR